MPSSSGSCQGRENSPTSVRRPPPLKLRSRGRCHHGSHRRTRIIFWGAFRQWAENISQVNSGHDFARVLVTCAQLLCNTRRHPPPPISMLRKNLSSNLRNIFSLSVPKQRARNVHQHWNWGWGGAKQRTTYTKTSYWFTCEIFSDNSRFWQLQLSASSVSSSSTAPNQIIK